MVSVSVRIKEKATTRHVRITAPSIRRAVELAGTGRPDAEVRLLFPIEAGGFFVDSPRVAAEHTQEAGRLSRAA